MPKPVNLPPDLPAPESRVRPARVMLSLDASNTDLGMLELAVNMAALLRGELCGLWLENAQLLQAAALPFACEIGLSPALERPLEPEQLLRSLRANRRRMESRLADLAQTAKVQWSLQAIQHNQAEAQWEAAVFDVLVMGQSSLSLRRSGSAVTQPVRQCCLLWWLDSAPAVAMTQKILERLAMMGALEVYLVSHPHQGAAAQELEAWLAAEGIPYYRLAYAGDPTNLKAILAALRIYPDVVLVPRSLGWEQLGKLASALPCPLLVMGEGNSGQLGQTRS